MPPSNVPKKWSIILTIFLMMGLGYAILLTSGLNLQTFGNLQILNNLPRLISTPGPTSLPNVSSTQRSFKILFQSETDKEGRTIIYETQGSRYSGAGELYNTATSPAKLTSVIGIFLGWKEISGSKDRYLLLDDPLTKKRLRDLRVAFEDSPLFDNGAIATALAVEDFSTGQTEPLGKLVKDMSDEELDSLIQIGDAIVAVPIYKDEPTPMADSQDNLIVRWLILRREQGLKSLNI